MKFHLPFVIAATTVMLSAQEEFKTPVLLVDKEGGFRQVWLIAATKSLIRYREEEKAMDTMDSRVSEFSAVYILEPAGFSEAMDLYEAGQYDEARKGFAKVREQFKPIQALNNNPSTLAAYYEMECMRKTGDFDALSLSLKTFVKDPLTRSSQRRQLDLYILWEAARTKSWERLEILVRQMENETLPGDQRAQMSYLRGLAMEGLNRPDEALFAYQTAMTAEAGASEEIARDAALRVLAIHKKDPEVQQAIKVWGTPDENKSSRGYSHLIEAGAVASLYDIIHGGKSPLPAEFREWMKYKQETLDVEAPES